MKQINYYLRFIVGSVFLLSGWLKAIDTAAFSNLMSSYGAEWFGYAAPILIFIEIALGILLIFNFRPRLLSGITTAFIIAVSTVFLYGLLKQGITDCGCFGPVTWLNTKPWLTFTRNGLLIALLIPSIIQTQQDSPWTMFSWISIATMEVVVMFMCGFSMHGAKCLQKHTVFEPIPLAQDPLADIITCHPDSTYLVVAFSYRCPYCQNSIGNINQYLSMNAVDRVIGLVAEDSIGRERFERLFDVNFEVREIAKPQLLSIAQALPTTYYIRHDSIISKYKGIVASPALSMP